MLLNLLSSKTINEDGLARFLYSSQRAKGIVKLLLSRKGVSFNDFDEIFQCAVFAFFEKSKKDGTKILGRSGDDIGVEGFYRVWWRVTEIVIYDYKREGSRHEHFDDDDHEEVAIQRASMAEACNTVAFEDKIGTQMVFDKFNSIFESAATDKIKRIITKVTEAPVSTKPKGRPLKTSLPLVSGVVFKPSAFNSDSDSAQKSARLAAIRKALGISILEFSKKLEISDFRLASYIYNKVKNIPKDVLDHAESIFDAEKGVAAATIAIDAMDILEILAIWRLAINGTNNELISLLGISPSTMVRWETQQTRPPIREIRKYNQIVSAAARLAASRAKKT